MPTRATKPSLAFYINMDAKYFSQQADHEKTQSRIMLVSDVVDLIN